MDRTIVLAVNSGEGKTRLLTANANKAVKVKLIDGNKYLLKNLGNDFAPENITLTRVGNELHVIQEGDTQASIIIEDYFNGNDKNPALLGMAEDGQLYAYVPLSGADYESGYLTSEGEMSDAALGGPALGSGEGIFTGSDDDSNNYILYGLLGWLGAAGLIGAGAAIANNNNDDGESNPPAKPAIGQALDNTGSITGAIQNGSVTDEAKPVLSGTGQPGNTITIYDNCQEIGSVVIDNAGNWTFTPENSLADGQHELVITETDPSGNISSPSDSLNFGVDTVAPGVPGIQHIMDKVGDTVGEIQPGGFTDDSRPEISGTGEAGSTVTIYDNGIVIGTAEVNAAGRWSFLPETALVNGSHNITVSQTDAAGNQSVISEGWAFTVDTGLLSQPNISEIQDNTGSITGPIQSGGITDETQPVLSGKGEPGNVIIIQDNGNEIGTTTIDENGNWTFVPELPLDEGRHELVITEQNQSGNKSEPSDPIVINVDTTAPDQPGVSQAIDNTGPITGIIQQGSTTDESRPQLSGVGEAGNTITIYDGGQQIGSVVIGEDGKWSFTPEEALSESDHSITVTESDLAGNESAPSESLDFTVDTTPPLSGSEFLAITAVADSVGDRQGNVASGEITDDSKPQISGIGTAGDTVFVYTTDISGNHLIGSAVVGEDGTWSMAPELPLLEGTNQLAIIAQDAAGNRTPLSSPSYDINIFIPVASGEPAILSVVDNVEPNAGALQKGDVTNDSTPTLSGSAEANSTVTVYDNGVAIGNATADAGGRWTFTPEAGLADGGHSLTITSTDAAGNVSAPSGDFALVIDTAAPEAAAGIVIVDDVGDKTGPVAPGETTDDRSPTLSGSGEPGSTVTVTDNGREIGTAVIDESGSWTFTPPAPLDNGEHNLSTTVTDAAGNVSEPSPGISIVVDDTPVVVSVGTVADSVGPVTGNVAAGGVTDDTRPEISGSGKPGSVVTVQDGDVVLGTTTVQPDGSWSFRPEAELGEGAHSLTATAEDAAGNSVTSPAVEFTVDSVAPEQPVIGGATDDVGDVRGPLVSGGVTDDATPTFAGTAEPGSTIDIYDNGGLIGTVAADENGAWSFTPTTPLAEGDHSLTTTATDAAGNTSAASDAFELTTDYTASPTGPEFLAITAVTDNVGSVTGPVVSGGVTDDSRPVISGIGTAGDTVIVYAQDASGNRPIGSATVQADGSWSLTPALPLLEGSNQLTLVAVDAAGNRTAPSAPSWDITVDISVPAVPAILSVVDNVEPNSGALQKGDVTNDSTPTLSGSAEANSTVTVYDNGVAIGNAAADAGGRWTFTPEAGLADGGHSLTITSTDAAGNVSAPSGDFALVIDTAAPEAAAGIVIVDDVGDKTGPVAPGETTDDRSPTLSGSGEPGSTVTVTDNGREIGTAVIDESGSWTFTPSEPLDNGEHNLSTTVTDAAGNVSEPSPGISIVVDDTPVVVSVGTVADSVGPVTGNVPAGGVTDDTRPEISGSGKPGSVVTVQDGDVVLGTTTVQPDGSWSFRPEAELGEGAHSLTATAEDAAGNSVTSPAVEFTVDSVAPEQPVIGGATDDVGDVRGPLVSGGVTDDATPTFAGTAEPGSTIDIYDNGGLIGTVAADENGAWSFTPTTPLAEGDHSLTTTATDAAGNTSAASDAFELTTDYTASPTGPEFLAITAVTDNVGSVTGPVVSGGVTDDSRPVISGIGTAGDTVIVYAQDASGNRPIGSATVQADGSWSLTPALPLLEGSNQLTMVAVDAAGNRTAPSDDFTLVIDTLAPEAATDIVIVDDVGDKTGPVAPGETTDDRSPTLSGSGEPGSTVTITDNGQEIGTAVIDESGSWAFTPSEPLDNGEHNLSTTVTDAAGNVSEPSPGISIVVDDTPVVVSVGTVTDSVGPVTGNVPAGGVTDDTRPEISGSGKPGSVVTVQDGDVVLGTTTVQPDGSWSFRPEAELGEGAHSLTATAEDAAGNSVTSPAVEFTVDSVAPEQPVIGGATDDVGDVRGPLVSGGVTDDATPTFTGTAEPGSTIDIYDNGGLIGTVAADENGAWSFTPTTPLAEGDHSLTTTATDAAGNTSAASDAFELTTDYTAPDASLVAITGVDDQVGAVTGQVASGGTTDDNRPTISGTGAEAGNTITVYNNGAVIGTATVQADGGWSMTPTLPLADGLYTLTATETDAVGNVTPASPEYAINVVTVAPNPPVITSVEGNAEPNSGALQKGDVTNDSTPTLSGSAVAGGTVTVFDNGAAIGTAVVGDNGEWSFTPSAPLAEGNHNLTASVVDSIGQTSPATGAFDIVVDTIAPDPVTGLTVTDDVGATQGALSAGQVTDDNTPTFGGRAEAGSTVTVYDNGAAIGSAVADASGAWSFTPGAALDNGAHDFTTRVTDAAGNTSAEGEHLVVTVDVEPGLVALTGLVDDVGAVTGAVAQNGVTDDTRPTLNGTAKADSVVTVMDGANVLGTTTANANGGWSFTPSFDLGQGLHSLSATAVDPAGNSSTSGSWSFTVDSIAPTAPTIDSAADDVGSVQPQAMASGSATDDPTPTLSGRAEANSTVTISDQNGVIGTATASASGSWTFTPSVRLSEGEHRFTVTATDAAGNVSDPSNTFVLTLDFTAPDASLVAITGVNDQVGAVTGQVASGGTTDDNRPTISGTGAEAGNTITVYNNGAVIGTATVQADGGWSMTPTLPLADGLYTLTATESDAVGNVTPASPEYAINVVTVAPNPPVITSVEGNAEPNSGALQKGDVTNDSTPTLSGSAVAGGTVTVFDNGAAIGTAVVDGSGAWSFTPSAPLAEGNHNLTASVTDSIGQTSPATGAFDIVVDTIAPDPVTGLTVTDDVGAEQGALSAGQVTDDNTPTFGGRAEAGSTVTVYDNGAAIGSAVADASGAWSFTPGAALDNGAHDFTTRVTDAAGNTSAEGEHLVVTVDVEPGLVALTGLVDDVGAVTGAVAQNGVTDDTRPTLNGTAKADSVVTVMDGANVLGTTTANANGGWSFTPTVDLGQGLHSLSATAVDPAGNSSTSGSWSFTVDSVAPTAPTIDSAADDVGSVQPQAMASGSATDDPTPTLSGRAEANSTVTISDQNGVIGTATASASGSWTFTPSVRLSEGEHRFTVTATDAAGNVSDPSNTFVLTLDFTAPDASLVAITGVNDQVGAVTGQVASGGTTDDNRPTISGTGAEAGNTITVYNNGAVIGTATVQADGGWSMTPTLPLADGLYTLTATESDAVGNVTPASPEYAINVVTVAPNPPVITSVEGNAEPNSGALQKGDVTNDSTPTLSGSAVAGGTVTVFDNGAAIGTAVVDGSGAWSFTPSAPLAEGNHNLTASVTDSIGQTSPATGAFDIVVDTIAPDPVTGLTVTDDVGATQGALSAGQVTDDNTPTFGGRAEAGSTVTVYDNGVAIGSAAADASGAWSFTPGAALDNGAHDFTTRVTDAAGNTSAEGEHLVVTVDVEPGLVALTGLVDDVGAVTGAIAQNGVTDDTRPTLNGTAKADSVVTVMDGANVLGTTTANANGGWSFTPSFDLGQGLHSLSATAVDPAGNSSTSGSWSFTVDSVAPTAPTIDSAADDVGSVQPQAMASGSATDDPTPTLSGRAEANSTVTISDQNGVIGTATASASGSWTFTPSVRLSEGEHRFTVTATDAAGNVSDPSNTFVLTLDFTAPDASLVAITDVIDNVGSVTGSVAQNGVMDDRQPVIRGTGAEVGNTITVSTTDASGNTIVLGTTTVAANGTWELASSGSLYDGLNQLSVVETDSVGNSANPQTSYDVNVSMTPDMPGITNIVDDSNSEIVSLSSGDLTKDNTPTLSGTSGLAEGGIITIYNGTTVVGTTTADANGDWSFTPDAGLSDGNYNFTVTATNSAGQESDRSNGYNLIIDATAPNAVSGLTVNDDVGAVTGVLQAGAMTDDTTPTFRGNAEAGSTVTIYANGEVLGSVTVTNPNGSWEFTPAEADALTDGNYQFATEVVDAAGNSSGVVNDISVTVSTVPGTLNLLQVVDNVEADGESRLLNTGDVTNDATPTFVGTATAGSTVTIQDGSSTILGRVTVDASGNWSFEPESALSEGVHNFVVSGTDATGNALDSIDFTLTIDTVAPVAPQITDVQDNSLPVLGTVVSGGQTNDVTPEIKGSAEANSTVEIYNQVDADNRVLLGSAIADSNGQWTMVLPDDQALTDGTYNLVAQSTDSAGNISPVSNSWTIVVDTAAPNAVVTITAISDDAGISDSDFNTNDSTLLIHGTLDQALSDGEWVEVSLDGGVTWNRALSNVGTDWTVDLQSTPLSSGNYTIEARVVDGAGNIGSTDTHALTVSTVGPDLNGLTTTVGITTDTSNGLVTGDLFSHSATATNNDMVTRDRTLTLTGNLSTELSANQYLQLSLDNGQSWTTVLAESGSQWSHGLDAVTASTTISYQLRVIDSAGNLGTNTNFDASYQVVIDLVAPEGILGAPQVDQIVDSNSTFIFSSAQYGTVEAGAIISLVSDVNRSGTYQEGLDQILGFAKANADGSWTLSTTLPAGAHNLAFMVWDEAGNRSGLSASTSIGVTDGAGSTLIEQSWGGTTTGQGYGLNAAAVTISSTGTWSFAQSVRGTTGTTTANALRVYTAENREDYTSTYLAQPSTTNGADYNVNDAGYGRFINSMVFADINRDGYTDVMSQVSSYGNANRTAYWMQNADGTYTPQALNQGTLNHLGGVIAYDREGDGYLDFVLADSEADSISFIKNENGTLSYEQASGFANGHPGGAIPANLSVLHEVGAVDIDNNGTVDITAHISYNGEGNRVGNNSRGLGIIYNSTNGTTSTSFDEVGYYSNVFRNDGADDFGNLSISMTYADFNGDGWLDLFISRGSKNGANGNESRIYLNDGTGKLLATDADALWFGDTLDGGTSLAVDWNHDGLMDIIEVPRSGVNGSPVLYTNQGSNVWGNGTNLTASNYNNLTGAVALDYDWDGSMDLVLYRSGDNAAVVSGDASAPTLLVKNTNIAADGTSLKIRILDGNGINTFYSNTVKLYDSEGNLVATQLINPQASGSSNSMGLVSFFGLDPNEVYSVQLLRITNGAANHVGSFAGEQGGNTNTTVNENWGGLTTGKAHDAYVLTAENTGESNNTTGASGITGTGYNDTFFSTAGDDTYTGGGGWNQVVSGEAVWSETEGLDTVDYSGAPGAVTANLWTGTATGHGNDTLISIEGLIGTSFGDTFTDNSANNVFEGRGGDDTFYLVNGGNDTLMYKQLVGMELDGTGGNGHDTVHGFHIGNLSTDGDADLIDLSDVIDYQGPISFFQDDGVMQLDYSSQGVLDYLKVEVVGNDTVISIDRDGTGGQHAFSNVLTLADVQTDLQTLLQNNQILI